MTSRDSLLRRQLLMLRALWRSPRETGALCPSSQALASVMSEAFDSAILGDDGIVAELGAGTGAVTEALLAAGIPRDRLIVVEKSPQLFEFLENKFPGVDVRCRAAEELEDIAGSSPVRAIVSSIPFRSLPNEASLAIMNAVERTLAPRGVFVQFTYALVGRMPFVPESFRLKKRRFVLLNIPPAKVEAFGKPEEYSRP